MKRFGFLDRVEADLREAGKEVALFESVEPVASLKPSCAVRAIWTFYEYPDMTFESLCIPFIFPKLRTKARICAIPSTSGTPTEVTVFSVITDNLKASSSRSQTSTLRRMWRLSIPTSPEPCPRS
jgi:alcohol dehydrogenase class IV